nr:MAG: hypothetical protein A2V48_02260 [Candidatus Amesbacteria bacterium RBG_19FT_COMBO_48_16]
MKEINILWVDSEHPESWEDTIEDLNQGQDFKVTLLSSTERERVIGECQGKDMVVIHRGFVSSVETKKLLEEINSRHQKIRIGLDSNAVNQILEPVTDFQVYKPITIDELRQLLKKAFK